MVLSGAVIIEKNPFDDEIEYDSFECGHIQSVFYGGKTNYNNLEPICSICNGSMGIMNLNEFKTSLMNS